jgi:peptide/nickel transport system permease protein/peptide/nickel transport system substrate-binding protein
VSSQGTSIRITGRGAGVQQAAHIKNKETDVTDHHAYRNQADQDTQAMQEEMLHAPHLMRRRDLLLAALSGAALAAVPGGAAFAQGAPRKGGVLKVVASSNPSSLDPATGGAGSDHSILWPMYDTLVDWDYQTLKSVPGLAEWSTPDPQTLMLKLRSDKIVFHDGTKLDAQAVKFNLDRNRSDARSNVKADLVNIAAVEVVSPLEVRIKLTQPDAALPAILSDRAGMMVSPKAVQELGNESDRKPVGAGPWKFVSWADNEKVVMTRHENYWKPDRPLPNGIEFAIIPDQATALRSVSSAQNHMVINLSPRYKPVVDRAKSLSLATSPTLYCFQIYFNYSRAPLDNVKVRQAINFAVDRKAFVNATLGGIGEPAVMLLPQAHWAYDKDLANLYPYDPARARKLLAEAGLANGLDLSIGGYTDQDSVRRAEVIIEMLGKAGIRAKFTNGTVPEISGQFFGNEKKFDALLSAWTGRPDPSMTYSLGFAKGAYYNAGRSEASPELTAALQESRLKEDLAFRKQALAKVQRIVMEQALVAPLAFRFEMVASVAAVKDFKPNLLGKPKFNDVWLAT